MGLTTHSSSSSGSHCVGLALIGAQHALHTPGGAELHQQHHPQSPSAAPHLLVLGQQLSHTLPDGTSAARGGEPEDSVGAPASILLAVDDVGDGPVHVHCGHALAQPAALHLGGRNSPHLQGIAGDPGDAAVVDPIVRATLCAGITAASSSPAASADRHQLTCPGQAHAAENILSQPICQPCRHHHSQVV
jgi:hypothetical protein